MLKSLSLMIMGLYTLSCIVPSYLAGAYLKSDPVLLEYYIEYKAMYEGVCKADMNKRLPEKAVIKFGPTSEASSSGRAIGVCSTYQSGDFVVKIDPTFYKSANKADRYHVVMHELTHCVLGMDHSSDPQNYMYPTAEPMPIEKIKEQMKADMKAHCVN